MWYILERAFWSLQPFQGSLLLENSKNIATNVFLANMIKPRTYVNYLLTLHLHQIWWLQLKNESRKAKIDHLIKWSIMRIFNKAEPP